MNNTIKIYRSIGRTGSVISAELIVEIPDNDTGDLQELAEYYGGDYAIIESNSDCFTYQ